MKKVEITTRGSFDVIEESKGFSLSPVTSHINKYVCLNCGYISLYAENTSIFKK